MAALNEDVLFSGVAALSRGLRARELSPVALAEAYLARIEALAPRLGCFVTVTPERALADARAAEAELEAGRWRGPLHGVPYGLKDLIDTKGIRTTFGAAPFAERVPGARRAPWRGGSPRPARCSSASSPWSSWPAASSTTPARRR